MYYRDKYNDPLVLKLSVSPVHIPCSRPAPHPDMPRAPRKVFVLWILDSAHVALITGAMYWYCVTNFTNLAAVQTPIWPIPVRPVFPTVFSFSPWSHPHPLILTRVCALRAVGRL